MKILHGTWIPHSQADFMQTGRFCLWAETAEPQRRRRKTANRHPFQVPKTELATWLHAELQLGKSDRELEQTISTQYFQLPSAADRPLPSPELAHYWETDWPQESTWQVWQVDCYAVQVCVKTGSDRFRQAIPAIAVLNNLHFLARHHLAEVQLGSDLLFWYRYSRTLAQVIFKDQYIPALRYRDLSSSTLAESVGKRRAGKARKPSEPKFELYPSWEIVSERYETNLQHYAACMPAICTSGFAESPTALQLWDRATLLRHFSEVVLDSVVTGTASTAQFDRTLANSLLAACFRPDRQRPWRDVESLALYRQWQAWRQKLIRTQADTSFYVGFQLEDPGSDDADWELFFVIANRQDPSNRLLLADYWCMDEAERQQVRQRLGADFEQQLLVQLGYAARMYPLLWRALDRTAPFGLTLSLAEAFEFLTEFAWVLEDAGFKAIVPSWWTPAGRRRAKVKLRPKQKQRGDKQQTAKSYFAADQLVDYEYQLAIGDEPIDEREWEQLVEAKTPLVLFRGEWVELDPEKMQEMLEFWRSQSGETGMSLLDLVKLEAEGDGEIELDWSRDRTLAELMAQLRNPSQLRIVPNPAQLQAELREYQQRGLSWLHYLELLGLNGCLADDMGLGKTMQVIARLVQEREGDRPEPAAADILPTLLIVPTSVVGNWRREMEKFAPHLRVAIHHGSKRNTDVEAFRRLYDEYDVIVTSFTLARKDQKLLSAVEWHRVVLDEAQNIKNPKSAQTKAILKLSARHRLALTGRRLKIA